MSDQVIGRCSKCGGSLTAGHNCEPKNPFLGVDLVSIRIEQLEKRVGILEGKQQPQPQPTLVEAVEAMVKDANEWDGVHLWDLLEVAKKSLSRHKEREKLVDEILDSARSISQYNVSDMGICFPKLELEFHNLDAFDKGAV